MTDYYLDAESGEFITSGSAINAVYKSNAHKIAELYNSIDKTKDKDFSLKVRDILFKELHDESIKNNDTYKRQNEYGKQIFCIAKFMVFAGIVFSIVQFIYAYIIGDFDIMAMTFNVQNAGLAITTSAIGAFVLALSFLFFFLFLQFVYKPNSVRRNLFENIKDFRHLMDDKYQK
jgi:hypothetical protein